jgi:DNA gyrase subunit A
MLNLRDMVKHFVAHRHEVVVRRTEYELRQAEKRAHVLEGLLIAIDNLDAVIKLIRASATVDEAKSGLMTEFKLSDVQAKAILEMRLQKLTGLERDKIKAEYEELMKTIEYLKSILGDRVMRMEIIKDELLEIKEKYGDERRTAIEFAGGDVSIEDMIPDSEVVITISHAGYIKRTPLTEYKKQNRGGVGTKAASTRDKDFIEHVYVATNHQYMLFFTEQGRCFWMRVYEIPEGSRQSKGRAIQNLINLPQDDKVLAFINVLNLKDEEYINNHHIVMCTKKGVIKKTSLEAYSRPRVNGINAITIREGDTLLEAKLTNGEQDIMLAVRSGKAIRFPETKVRSMGRSASGVRAITVDHENDEVVGMIVVKEGDGFDVMVVSEAGYGKRSSLEDYRITNRGGKGVKTITVTEKTGELVSLKAVTDEDDLMIITKKGTMIRMGVNTLRVMGRATQGVRLINLRKGDEIASIAKVPASEEEEELLDAEGNVIVATEGEEGATAPEAPTESED